MNKYIHLTDCVTGAKYLYSLCDFRGHTFRQYEDGSIRRADESDKRAADWARKWIDKRGE